MKSPIPTPPLTWKHYLSAVILVLGALLNFSQDVQTFAASWGIPLPARINFALLVIVAFCDSILPLLKRLGAWFINLPIDSVAAQQQREHRATREALLEAATPDACTYPPDPAIKSVDRNKNKGWGSGGDNPPSGGSSVSGGKQ